MKKILITTLMIIVILGLGASYIFTGFTPRQQTPRQPEQSVTADFVGPTDTPHVTGPSPSSGN